MDLCIKYITYEIQILAVISDIKFLVLWKIKPENYSFLQNSSFEQNQKITINN